MDHLLPWLGLQLIPDRGRVGLMHLIEHFKTPEKTLVAAEEGWPLLPGLRANLAAMIPEATSPRTQEACQRLEEMGGIPTLWDLDYPVLCAWLRADLHCFTDVALTGFTTRKCPDSITRLSSKALFYSGGEPLPVHFPGHNRIISGLSKATLMIETSRKSGSLIRVEFDLEEGREAMAVPGGVDRKTRYRTNFLIKQGRIRSQKLRTP